ncbi:MAG: hypothetical protein PVSMB4_15350 [Ktedonobacterales bacterium]
MLGTVQSMLHRPDDPWWHRNRQYSFPVAQALRDAYDEIVRRRPATQGYQRARAHLMPYTFYPMCKPQRLLVTYVLAMSYAAEREYGSALEALNEALNLVEELGDRGAFAELAFLRAAAHRAQCQYVEAARYHRVCIETLWELGMTKGNEAVDPALELSCLVDLAAVQTMLADFAAADWCLHESQRLSLEVPEARLEAGMIPWVRAVSGRYRGDLASALRDAMHACDIYADAAAGAPAAQARIQIVVADIALDMAEQAKEGKRYTARSAHLRLAAPYVKQGLKLARSGGDRTGEGLALLAHARYARLTKRNTSRQGTIESVLRLADDLDDPTLRGQAYIVLGQERAAQGESIDAQVDCYDRATEELSGTDLRAIAMLARRAALRAREQRDM